MRKLLLLLALSLPAFATVRCVGSGSTGCGTTYANNALQTAFNDAVSGDTISLQPGFTYSGEYEIYSHGCVSSQPITVKTAKTAWLPASSTTPVNQGDYANMAHLSSDSNPEPALRFNTVGGAPASCWHFEGVGFTCTITCYFIVDLNFSSITPATSSANLPTDVSFIHCAFYLPNNNHVTTQHALRAEARNLTVKGSFFDQILSDLESHGIGGVTLAGPFDFEGNAFFVAGIPILLGGGPPDYHGAVPNDVTVKYNYFGKYYKWWNDATNNPYQADFVTNGDVTRCTKNTGEFKTIHTGLWQYNTHELPIGGCGSQQNGLTMTPRTDYGIAASGFYITSGTNTFTYTGGDPDGIDVKNPGTDPLQHSDGSYTPPVGQSMCGIAFPGGVQTAYCHTITSFNLATKSGVVDANWEISETNGPYMEVKDPSLEFTGVTIQDNILREAPVGISVIGADPTALNASNKAVTRNLTITNNLMVNLHVPLWYSMKFTYVPGLLSGVGGLMNGATNYGYNWSIHHNTFVAASRAMNAAEFYFAFDDVPLMQFVDLLDFRDNVADSGDYGVFGTGGGGATMVNGMMTTNGKFRNNVIPGSTITCSGGRDCTNNKNAAFDPQFVSVSTGNYAVGAGSAYNTGSTTSGPMGVNMSTLPYIQNFTVTPGANSVAIAADIGPVISSIPCKVDISTSENLRSGLGTWTPVNAANPAYFIQANTTDGDNPSLPAGGISSNHLTWTIGSNSTVTDDTGSSRSLALAPSTQHWGRLWCGGNMQAFTFTTTSGTATRTFGGGMKFGGGSKQ